MPMGKVPIRRPCSRCGGMYLTTSISPKRVCPNCVKPFHYKGMHRRKYNVDVFFKRLRNGEDLKWEK